MYLCIHNYQYMSQFVIYIQLPLYLSEWLTNRLGDPVVFPAKSPQNSVIRTFTLLPPSGYVPECGGPGLTAITIPDSVSKPPERYFYMTQKGKEAVAEACKDLFLRALWADISSIADSPVGLNKLIAAWCESNGIGLDRVETVRQCFYRIRRDYARKGVNLRICSRKK